MTRFEAAPSVAAFEGLCESRYPLHNLAQQLAPHIVGLDRAKRALCLALASVEDSGTSRGRIHAVLHGPTGAAKSSLVEAAALEAGVEVLSSRMSPGSLTIDFRNGRIGALGQAHHTEFQVLCIDEIEKVPIESLRQMLRAMEEGEFAVPGESAPLVIPAHWRLLATANDISQLPEEFLNRFDFRILIPLPKKHEAKGVLDAIAGGFMREKDAPASPVEQGGEPVDGEVVPVRPRRAGGFVQSYLRWCRDWKPEFPEDERRLAAQVFRMLVDSDPAEEIRIRPYEAVLRVAYAIARIERGHVTAERVMAAVRELHPERDFSDTFEGMTKLLAYLRKRKLRPARHKKQG